MSIAWVGSSLPNSRIFFIYLDCLPLINTPGCLPEDDSVLISVWLKGIEGVEIYWNMYNVALQRFYSIFSIEHCMPWNVVNAFFGKTNVIFMSGWMHWTSPTTYWSLYIWGDMNYFKLSDVNQMSQGSNFPFEITTPWGVLFSKVFFVKSWLPDLIL